MLSILSEGLPFYHLKTAVAVKGRPVAILFKPLDLFGKLCLRQVSWYKVLLLS